MKAKRFISAVCALAMTAASAATFVNAAGEQVIIKGDQIEKAPGASFELNFNLDKFDGTGFSGCEFAIAYDPKQITDVKVAEGAVLKTGATAAELEKSPTIGEEVTMVNKGKYDCFDYNTAEVDGKNVIAVLWCTGLDSDKYWAKETGAIVSVTGTVSKDAKIGDKIPVEMIAIPREGNKTMTFGYADGNKDVTYTSAVEQQGLITVAEVGTPGILWGDVNDDGALVESKIYDRISRAEGIWIVAAGEGEEAANITKSSYYDFYIRTCWHSVGDKIPSTITTSLRLYNPEVIE